MELNVGCTVRVDDSGKAEIISGRRSTLADAPKEKGTYQWRPVGKRWGSDVEHGSWLPVYGWVENSKAGPLPKSVYDLPEV